MADPRFALLALSAIIAAAPPATARWAMPTDAPVDRLIDNLTEYLRKHPEDAEGHFLMGRVHSLAFALRTEIIGEYSAGSQGELPNIPDRSRQIMGHGRRRVSEPFPDPDRILGHLSASIQSYRAAIALAPSLAQYHLGLAWVLDTGAHLAEFIPSAAGLDPQEFGVPKDELEGLEGLVLRLKVDPTPAGNARSDSAYHQLQLRMPRAVPILLHYRADPDAVIQQRVAQLLRQFWKDQAIEAYYSAYTIAVAHDTGRSSLPLDGLAGLVSYEAGQAYVRLVKERGGANEQERQRVEEVEKAVANLQAKPLEAITPIIFSMDEALPIEDLLAPGSAVRFDLAGDGRPRRWPWVKPSTAILAWDPQRRGVIESGRQLFGSVTWWMFFPDGYRALDALDDDRDGELRGRELDGLALWFDRNGDGISDAGEVVPIEHTAIDAIASRPAGSKDGLLHNPSGVRLAGGRTLPTWDWVASPLRDE